MCPCLGKKKVYHKVLVLFEERTLSLSGSTISTMNVVENLTWVLVVLSVVGNISIVYDFHITGYSFWTVANVGWISYNLYIEEFPQMSLFVVYLFLSLLGIYKQVKKEPILPQNHGSMEPNGL